MLRKVRNLTRISWETRVFWSSGYYLGVGSKLEMNLICLVVPHKRGNY